MGHKGISFQDISSCTGVLSKYKCTSGEMQVGTGLQAGVGLRECPTNIILQLNGPLESTQIASTGRELDLIFLVTFQHYNFMILQAEGMQALEGEFLNLEDSSKG